MLVLLVLLHALPLGYTVFRGQGLHQRSCHLAVCKVFALTHDTDIGVACCSLAASLLFGLSFRDEGRINVKSRWKEYGPTVEEDPVYVAVKKNTSGSRPKELFEDLVVVS